MTDFFFSQTAAELQANHDKVSQTTGTLIDENNLGSKASELGLSKYTENRFKGNQNWNVEGDSGKPVPSATPTDYNVGEEVASGVEVITANALDVTLVNGVLKSTNASPQGILRRRYAKDTSGLITKTSQYGGVKLPDGSQLQALVDVNTNGVQISEVGNDVVVDVDLSVLTDGFRFHGLSDESGLWPDINDYDSFINLKPILDDQRNWIDVSSIRTINVLATPSNLTDTEVFLGQNADSTMEITVDGRIIMPVFSTTTSYAMTWSFTVPRSAEYKINTSVSPIFWEEYRK